MRKFIVIAMILTSAILLGGCGKFEDISIHGMKNVELRGISNGRILLNLTLDIENPNNRKLTITKIEFNTWLNNRELGKFKNSKKIVLQPNSREEIKIPVEIVLRTSADIFKLMNLKADILKQLTVEGFIKGRAMCISKKIRIEKQPFSKLANSYKGKFINKDTIPTRDTILQNDTLKVE